MSELTEAQGVPQPPAPPREWTPSPDQTSDEARRQLADLRSGCPVAHSPAHDGFWLLSRFADVRGALRNDSTYRSGRPFLDRPGNPRIIPLTINKPEHTTYRRALQTYFRPQRVAMLETPIRDLVHELLDPLVARGGGDAVAEIAYSLPVRVLCSFMNLPDDLWRRLKELSDLNSDAARRSPEVAQEVDRQFAEAARSIVDMRRADPLDPEEDLLSGLLADSSQLSLTDDELASIVVQMLSAGHATTTRAMSSALHTVAVDPEEQRRLREQPDMIPQFVEEVLRLDPPLHLIGRQVSTDVTVGDQCIRDGEHVGLHLGSANRDEATFDDPDAFRAARSPNPHLTFGLGAHTCLGAPIARLEMRILLEELLGSTRSVQLAGEPVPVSGYQSGFRQLPLGLVGR